MQIFSQLEASKDPRCCMTSWAGRFSGMFCASRLKVWARLMHVFISSVSSIFIYLLVTTYKKCKCYSSVSKGQNR
ncbi:hypothetical protein X975_07573, partial [Stegodyphus mimosarum]